VVTRQHRRLRTRADVDEYFERFVALFRSIEQHGVVRRAAGRDRDIGVALGPWGDLVRLPGGQHRLAIASVLGLERIPVQIRMVHADLLRRRMDGRELGPVAALDSLFADPCDSVVTA
jgi:ParB-like chromosome segregation protein Spo0J